MYGSVISFNLQGEALKATIVAKKASGWDMSLVDLLFKGYRQKVLALLLMHPDRSFYVREIARLTDTVAGTLHKELTSLASVGILLKQSQGNQIEYKANKDCIVYEELASIVRKTTGLADVLKQSLADSHSLIQCAFVFGSIASGKNTDLSDIDLLVIGDISFSELVKAIYPAQQQLHREINPKLYSVEEWDVAKQTDSVFISELMNKPVINIVGKLDDVR